jgi:hypothetical protein
MAATVFERDCGATTRKNIQVAIHPKSQAFDAMPRNSLFVIETDSSVTVSWKKNDTLIIRYPNAGRIFRKETQTGGIAVDYISD